MREGVAAKTSETACKKREKAEQVKYEKMEVTEHVQMVRQQEQLKNASLKQMIKNQENELQEKKHREFAERKAKAR